MGGYVDRSKGNQVVTEKGKMRKDRSRLKNGKEETNLVCSSPTMAHPLPQLPPIHTSFIRKLDNDNDNDNDNLGLANNAHTVQAVPSFWGIPLKYISSVSFLLD